MLKNKHDFIESNDWDVKSNNKNITYSDVPHISEWLNNATVFIDDAFKSLTIENIILPSQVVLRGRNKEIYFKNCEFKDQIIFDSFNCSQKIHFVGCKFLKGYLFKDTTIRELNISDCELRDEMVFEGLYLVNKMTFTNNSFSKGFKLNGFLRKRDINYNKCEFSFFNNNFNGSFGVFTSLSGVRLLFKNNHFNDEYVLNENTVLKLSIKNCFFAKPVEIYKNTFVEGMDISYCETNADFTVLECEIQGNLFVSLNETTKDLTIELCKISGVSYFQTFNYKSILNLTGSSWDGIIVIRGFLEFGTLSLTNNEFNSFVGLVGNQFLNDVSFANSKILKKLDLSNTVFMSNVDFSGLYCEGNLSLSNCVFEVPPSFQDSYFKVSPDLTINNLKINANSLNYPKFDYSNHWRSIRRVAIQSHNTDLERFAFGNELINKRKYSKLDLINNISNYAYQTFSEFGYSIQKPIIWLFISFVLFATIYLLSSLNLSDIELYRCRNSEGNKIISSLSISFQKTMLLPNSFNNDRYSYDIGCLYKDNIVTANEETIVPFGVTIFTTVQTLLSVIFLFLLTLGMRNQFKIK